MPRENIWVTDIEGVVYEGRTELMDADKARYAQETDARTLADVIAGADVFLGLSAGGVLKPDDGERRWRAQPLILALANPDAGDPAGGGARRCATTPSSPPAAPTTRTRSTTSCASRSSSAARSTCGATTITEAMKLAAVRAIAELAQAEQTDVVAAAYGGDEPALRPRVPDPQALRPAPDRARSRRRWRRRRWTAAWRRGRSPTSTPTASSCTRFVYHSGHDRCSRSSPPPSAPAASAWSTPRARTSACCARCRWWSTRAWRGRS
ncbi:MAG: hypothetical protein MZW92_80510 [Comamonadaceae bacterium]|nr:hypothetical protein [Comamonadaceae bacterium]